MKRNVTFIFMILFVLILLASCSAEPEMHKEETVPSLELASYIQVKNADASGNSLFLTIARAEVEELHPELLGKTENDLYALSVKAPTVLINFPPTMMESCTMEWYINGVETKAQADGSLYATFQHSGYRDINCIVTIHFTSGGRFLADSHTFVTQYPED